MNLFGVCAIGLIAASAALIFREWKSGAAAAAVSVAGVCVITVAALLKYSDVIESLVELAGSDGAVSDAASLAVRALGVGFVAQIGSDICRDLGEGSLAACIENVGRVEILLLCLPEFVAFVNKAVEMIG